MLTPDRASLIRNPGHLNKLLRFRNLFKLALQVVQDVDFSLEEAAQDLLENVKCQFQGQQAA